MMVTYVTTTQPPERNTGGFVIPRVGPDGMTAAYLNGRDIRKRGFDSRRRTVAPDGIGRGAPSSCMDCSKYDGNVVNGSHGTVRVVLDNAPCFTCETTVSDWPGSRSCPGLTLDWHEKASATPSTRGQCGLTAGSTPACQATPWAKPSGDIMHACTECGTEYRSRLSADECADFDIQEARNTRDWFTHYNPNYRP